LLRRGEKAWADEGASEVAADYGKGLGGEIRGAQIVGY